MLIFVKLVTIFDKYLYLKIMLNINIILLELNIMQLKKFYNATPIMYSKFL